MTEGDPVEVNAAKRVSSVKFGLNSLTQRLPIHLFYPFVLVGIVVIMRMPLTG